MKRIIVKRIHSRRSFLTKLIGAGIILNFPFVNSCNRGKTINSILDRRQEQIVNFALNFLYPDDGLGPDLNSVKTYEYLLWVLSDKNIDPEENQYLLNGIRWIDETSVEIFNVHFEKLDKKQKFKLLKQILNEEWGESYLSKLLTIIIESLFADPIYGSNPKGIIWEFYNHNPGQPRPEERNKYQSILLRKKENIVFTSLKQL